MRRSSLVIASLLALAGCNDDGKPPATPPSHRYWTEDFSLDCNDAARARQVRECDTAFYRLNSRVDPQLESEAFERCRLAANVMYCAWRKP